MNFLFLSPAFPPQFFLFCQALEKEGLTVLGMGDTPAHELRSELREALTEYVHVPDMGRYDNVLRAAAYLTWRHGRIDRVDSHNEHWLDLEAKLRADFNIEGPKPEDVAKTRSKTGMRAIYRSAKIPCTDGERLDSFEQASAFAKKHGYPLVVKPDVGVGAAATFRVKDEAQLKAACDRNLKGYVVEKFVEGKLTSLDGLCDADGRILFHTSHVYSSGVMDIVNEALDIHYYSRREIPAELEELGKRAARAFGVKARFFHGEFFELPDGSFKALEMNVRPPGGFTTDLMNYACDLDLYRVWAQVISGKDLSAFTFERKFHTAHVARRNGRSYRNEHRKIVEKTGKTLLLHRQMPSVFSGAMGDEMYLLRDPDQASLDENIAFIQAR